MRVAGVERSEPPEWDALGAQCSFLAFRPQPPKCRFYFLPDPESILSRMAPAVTIPDKIGQATPRHLLRLDRSALPVEICAERHLLNPPARLDCLTVFPLSGLHVFGRNQLLPLRRTVKICGGLRVNRSCAGEKLSQPSSKGLTSVLARVKSGSSMLVVHITAGFDRRSFVEGIAPPCSSAPSHEIGEVTLFSVNRVGMGVGGLRIGSVWT